MTFRTNYSAGEPLPAADVNDAHQKIVDNRPTGEITMFAGSSAPTGWLICDGSAKDTTTYADLFAVIGYTYGGSGATFNLPNLQGNIPVGLDSGDTDFDTLGETGGAKTHTLSIAEIPNHNHEMVDMVKGINGSAGSGVAGIWEKRASINTQNTGGGGSHNNVQPYIVLHYIIRY